MLRHYEEKAPSLRSGWDALKCIPTTPRYGTGLVSNKRLFAAGLQVLEQMMDDFVHFGLAESEQVMLDGLFADRAVDQVIRGLLGRVDHDSPFAEANVLVTYSAPALPAAKGTANQPRVSARVSHGDITAPDGEVKVHHEVGFTWIGD